MIYALAALLFVIPILVFIGRRKPANISPDDCRYGLRCFRENEDGSVSPLYDHIEDTARHAHGLIYHANKAPSRRNKSGVYFCTNANSPEYQFYLQEAKRIAREQGVKIGEHEIEGIPPLVVHQSDGAGYVVRAKAVKRMTRIRSIE